MRVFMTTDSIGGVWTYSLDLARALGVYGVQTTLAVMGRPPSKADAAEARRVAGLTLIETNLPLDWIANDAGQVTAAATRMAALARDAGADIVHLNSPALAALADFTQPIVGVCHSCLATWWDTIKGGQPPTDMAWRIELLRRGYDMCARLVAPSASFAAMTAHVYGHLPLVIPNGRCAPEQERYPHDRGRFVLTAGRLWDDGKNVAAIDDAAAFIDAPVMAAGSMTGPTGGCRQLRVVTPLGHLNEAALQDWMARAPVFTSMALYEPFGLSVLEAAQAGCALVLSGIPTFRELWSGAAIFVPAAQPSRLVEAWQRLLDDPALARELGEAARVRASRYDATSMAARMHGLYTGLLNNSFARRHAARLVVS